MKVSSVTIEDAEGGGLKMVRTPTETIDEAEEADFRCSDSGVQQGSVRGPLSFMETPLLSGGVDSSFMLARQESTKSGSMVRVGTYSSSIHQAGTSRAGISRRADNRMKIISVRVGLGPGLSELESVPAVARSSSTLRDAPLLPLHRLHSYCPPVLCHRSCHIPSQSTLQTSPVSG